MEEKLAKLVAMPTISDDITANDLALDYLEHFFAERGMYCQRNRFDGHSTLLASTRQDNLKTPLVLLAGHIDVVAASEQMFTLRRQGDKLIGRGVYDMKFAIAGYMQLIDDLAGNLEAYDLAVMVTSDEEYGGRDNISGTLRLIESGCRPQICVLPDSTAPGWEIETLAKSPWRFDLIAKGRTAHGSRPWEGESASFKLIQALHELKTHFEGHGPETDTLNIGKIHGGITYNQIPSEMEAAIEIRLMNEASFARLSDIVQELCRRHELEYRLRVVSMPHKTDITDPLIQTYLDSVEAVTGRRPRGFTSFAASDAPYFDEIGVPCIISCPEGGKHHSEEEWISRKSFLQFGPILHDFIAKTAKIPERTVDKKAALV